MYSITTILQQSLATVKVAWDERKALAARIQKSALVFLAAILSSLYLLRFADAAQPKRIEYASAQPTFESILAGQQQAADAEQALLTAKHTADCEAVARVLYGTALHHSEEAQEAVVWCIINRVESSLYPDSVQAVCSQPSQFMGYSDDNPIIRPLYDTADRVLTEWEAGGYRLMAPDYLYITWTNDEIILRTTFEETSHTHYWAVQ